MLAGMLNWALAGTLDQDVGWDTEQRSLAEMLNWALTGTLDWALARMLDWVLAGTLDQDAWLGC